GTRVDAQADRRTPEHHRTVDAVVNPKSRDIIPGIHEPLAAIHLYPVARRNEKVTANKLTNL
ncbi:MAG: hypothetical protein KDK08_23335, partial [Rhizobiaceae bacterium]|nr:hypothetical protein [Rhizobiaceae bacterium]